MVVGFGVVSSLSFGDIIWMFFLNFFYFGLVLFWVFLVGVVVVVMFFKSFCC